MEDVVILIPAYKPEKEIIYLKYYKMRDSTRSGTIFYIGFAVNLVCEIGFLLEERSFLWKRRN